jgi:hypothetical protein
MWHYIGSDNEKMLLYCFNHNFSHADDDASGLMCMANTTINTKQMRGSPREMSYKACIRNAMKADESRRGLYFVNYAQTLSPFR